MKYLSIDLKSCKGVWRVLLVLTMTLFLASACSDDDVPTTGVLRVEFTHWDPSWTNHLGIEVAPYGQETIRAEQVKYRGTPTFELNPGNYKVMISLAKQGTFIIEYVQVQAGRTEVLKI